MTKQSTEGKKILKVNTKKRINEIERKERIFVGREKDLKNKLQRANGGCLGTWRRRRT